MRTPRGERLHIVFTGICNAGKSSLVNAIAGRTLSIVADHPGTTTDPVEKSMEFSALGPVVLVDTAGLDDASVLGSLRTARTNDVLQKADIIIFVTPGNRAPLQCEQTILQKLQQREKPIIVAVTFSEAPSNKEKVTWLEEYKKLAASQDTQNKHRAVRGIYYVSNTENTGIESLKRGISSLADTIEKEITPLEGLVNEGDSIMLVTPIDSAAPKGRLILPETEVLRDALDRNCTVITVQPAQLGAAYANLMQKPKLVVTDSQAFSYTASVLPLHQALTSFSILFARKKGELAWFRDGIAMLDRLNKLNTINLLAIEACTHNRTHEDIATVKIPAMLHAKTGVPVSVTAIRSLSDKPPNEFFDIAVICGSCMATRTLFKAQIAALHEAGIPVVNFGLALAWGSGLMPRAIELFPEYSILRESSYTFINTAQSV